MADSLVSRQPTNKLSSGWLGVLAVPQYRAFFFLLVVYGLASSIFFPLIGIWATTEYGATPSQVGLMMAMSGLGGLLTAIVLGPISDRLGKRRPLLLVTTLMVIVAWWILYRSRSLPIAMAGWSMANAGPISLAFAMMGDLVTSAGAYKGRVIGVVRTGFSVGWVAGPALGGLLADAIGYRNAMLAVIVMYVVGFLVALFGMNDVPHRAMRAG